MKHEEGSTRFVDGMRVTSEHLVHLQDVLMAAVVYLRQTVGTGKVVYGLKVEPLAADKVKVGKGIAFDRLARPLALEQEKEIAVSFSSSNTLYLILLYALRSETLVDGIYTILSNDLKVESRTAAPPYTDEAVIFAELHLRAGKIEVVQKGEWYLPPLNHGHSGQFFFDQQMRWRFDGHRVGIAGPLYDSGFIQVEAGGEVRLNHGLKTSDLLVQIQARLPDASVTNAGVGQNFWYELIGDQEVRLKRGTDASAGRLELRVMIWPYGQAGAGPLLPMADAGDDLVIESGNTSFTLDATRSRAFEGRVISSYIWLQHS
jgi:hypothetical protein